MPDSPTGAAAREATIRTGATEAACVACVDRLRAHVEAVERYDEERHTLAPFKAPLGDP